ncbi:amidase [Mycolicibacter hiberniae]|uniref:amidase n=2 Tax=Mycolicibacter hiberniae TaxID=29314 RepID=A0A7I7X7S7_9MYCO|nr:amidase family protein [Mycolicibacter hiberniae]MCV7087194.1 amidase [Mycolicibacter hiberniae]BBZ25594.1 putative amidase AmiB2 [Mycolicibacter hiberniae]
MSAAHDEELVFAGVARLAQLVRAREVSPRELVALYLDRIASLDPVLNVFRTVLGDRAMAEAARVEQRLAAGEALPLAGVPIAIKDDTDVAGVSSMCGTGIDVGPASTDSAAVRRLRSAGAVIIGKTHLSEFGAYPVSESATWGVTRNPWDLYRTPGGSSGGSAAAVAAGMVPGATGSDSGGSVRIPAACCGLVGLKGQRGRISTKESPERAYRFHGLNHIGPLARSVIDAALLHDAMTGPEPDDEIASPPPAPPLTEALLTPPRRLRIAMSFKPVVPVAVSDEVRRPVLATAELLRSLGHEVIERDPVYPVTGIAAVLALFMNGFAHEVERLPKTELLERRMQAEARTSRLVPDWLARWAVSAEPRITARSQRPIADVDLLMTPVLAIPPVRVGYFEGLGPTRAMLRMLKFIPFTFPQCYSGQPAMSIPTGISSDGLPEAVHLVARANDEATLVSLAAEIESVAPWAQRRPPTESLLSQAGLYDGMPSAAAVRSAEQHSER